MKHLLLVAIALASIATPALAGSRPGDHHRVVLRGTVCASPLTLRSKGSYADINPYVDSWVNGRRLLGALKGSTVYMFGANAVVQVPRTENGPFIVRATRTMEGCAPLRVVFTWITRD